MTILLGILDYYLPALPLIGLVLIIGGIYYYLSHRRHSDVKDESSYDYEVIAHDIWLERGYAAWKTAWEKEQERER